jgi:F0F1-type ATP synthase delta subunit
MGAKKRHHPDADLTEDLRDLRAARLEEQIARVVSAAPPLTPEQLERLRALLAPSA